MKTETYKQILHDLEFLGLNPRFSNTKEIAQCMSTYLFALAQHGLISSKEFKDIADLVVKAYTEEDEE